MPALSAPSLVKWRSSPSGMKLAAFLLKPTAVFSGQVNQPIATPFDYVVEFGVDNTSGSFASVYPGMTLTIGSTPGGRDLGRHRVRITPTASTVYCAASSKGTNDGELVVEDNAYFTIWNDYRVWTKVPRIDELTGVQYKDYNVILQAQQPKANSGGGLMGFTSGGVLTANFSGSQSYDLQDNAITHNWNLMDGTPGTSTSATPTGVTFPAGFRWVRHTIFAGTESHTMVVPVAAKDASVADVQWLDDVEIVSYSQEANGQELTLRINQEIDPDDFPDGTLLMVMDVERWGDGTDGPITVSNGPAGRGHMLFVGWHHETPTQISGARQGIRRDLTMNFLDIAGKLQTLPNWTQIVERAASPTDWFEQADLDINRVYPDYLLRWHSTALELADFHPYATEYPVATVDSDGQSLFNQTDTCIERIACNLTCDREGALWITGDQQLLATADQIAEFPGSMPERSTVSVLTLDENIDFTDFRYKHVPHPRHHWLNAGALASSTANAADLQGIDTRFVISPGTVPGQGLGAATDNEQVVNTVAEVRIVAGNRYSAYLNAPHETFTIKIAHPNRCGVDPAYGEWITLNLTAATAAQRGLTFTSARFLVRRIDWDIDQKYGNRTQTWTVEKEQWGYPATVLPQRENYAPPYEVPEISTIEPTVSTFVDEDGSAPITLYVLLRTGRFFRGGWNGARFVFEEMSPSGGQRTAIGATSPPNIAAMFIFDPYDYKRVIIYASLGVAICDDVTAAVPTWTTVTGFLPSGVSYLHYGGVNGIMRGEIVGSGLRRNWFGWIYLPSTGNGAGFQYTTDNFVTFGNIDLDTSDAYANDLWRKSGLTMSSHTAGKLWAGTGRDVYVSTNWGVSWAQETYPFGSTVTDQTGAWQPPLNMPFAVAGGGNNTANASLFSYLVNPSTGHRYVAVTGRTPFRIADDSLPRSGSWHSFTLDANYLAAITGSNSGVHVYTTEDNGQSWVEKTATSGGVSKNYESMNGWPGNHNYLLAFGMQSLCFTLDFGVTWNDTPRLDFLADIGEAGLDSDIIYATGWLGDIYPVSGIHP